MLPALLLFAALNPQAQPPVILWPHGVSPLGHTHKEIFANHTMSVSIHDEHSEAEVHESFATIMVIETGEADLLYGGEVINPKRTAPTEVRGSGIRYGATVHVVRGDVIHFAAGVPHQWLVSQGQQITFLVIHIDNPPKP